MMEFPTFESFVAWMKDFEIKKEEKSDLNDGHASGSNAGHSSGSTAGINLELLAKAKVELERIIQLPGNDEPDRGNLDDSAIEWRSGKPDYTLANLAFLKGKCTAHEMGSLELVVQNAVKTWEMEASHKKDPKQWTTIVHEKYKISANGGRSFDLKEASERGNYNVLMSEVDKSLYDASKEDFESSHHLFRDAFNGHFPWEVLNVYAGPPDLVFSFRHWAEFTGEYKGNKGDGRLVEMKGFAWVTVTNELKITDIRVFYKPEEFLRALKGGEEQKRSFPLRSSFASWLAEQNIEACEEINSQMIAKAREEIKRMTQSGGLAEPDRGDLSDSSVAWKSGKPNYELIDLAFIKGKSELHERGSVELQVENLIKRCEMEISYKAGKSLAHEFKLEVNGDDASSLIESYEKDPNNQFVNAFPWEVTKLYSQAPEFAFAWRHWTESRINKKEEIPRRIELKGFAIVTVNERFEIEKFKVFYKPEDIPQELLSGMKKCPFACRGNNVQ